MPSFEQKHTRHKEKNETNKSTEFTQDSKITSLSNRKKRSLDFPFLLKNIVVSFVFLVHGESKPDTCATG